MPVSQKPRRKKGESSGPCTYSVAGTLLYSFYEAGELRKRQHRVPTQADVDHRIRVTRRRRSSTGHAGCDIAGSRPALRRLRQKLVQHPSVIARFANHPTRAQIEEAAARIEQLDPLRKIEGETKQQRDARIKRERRQASAA